MRMRRPLAALFAGTLLLAPAACSGEAGENEIGEREVEEEDD